MLKHFLGIAALLIAATVWGATFVLVKDTIQLVSPEFLIASRFLIAGATLLVIQGLQRSLEFRRSLAPGLTLGLLILSGYWLQTRGLLEISPSRSAFVTGTTAVMVPFVDRILFRMKLRPVMIAGAVAAVAGLYFLVGGIEGRVYAGDVLTFVCAILFAFHVVLSAHWAKKYSGMSLATLQIAFVGLAASPALIVSRPAEIGRFVVLSILFLALVTTALAFYLLMWGQARLTAAEAAIILAFEPVAAAITSLVFYGEPLVFKQHILGGGLILAAMLLSQWKLPESESSPLPG